MVHIQNVNIEGFKAIKSINISPKKINIITGRNNTGKTSLLEGIEFGLNPRILKSYEHNVKNAININANLARVEIETKNEEIYSKLSKPKDDNKSDIFVRLFTKEVKNHELTSADKDWTEMGFLDFLSDSLTELLNRLDSKKYKKLKNNVLIVEHCGGEYPMIYAENTFYSDFIEDNEESLTNIMQSRVKKDLMEQFEQDEELEQEEMIKVFKEFLKIIYSEKSVLLDDLPVSNDDTMILQYTSLDDQMKPRGDLNDEVKKVEIREYLNNHNITPEHGTSIDSFDFDQIVFDRNGDHYELPFTFMGDGYKTFIGFLWEFMGESGKENVAYIEEPENHLHPGYVSKTINLFVEMVREKDMQMFITTHDIDVLSEFFGELSKKNEEFLKDNFQLIQMTETLPKIFDYSDAREQFEDLQLDLRGI